MLVPARILAILQSHDDMIKPRIMTHRIGSGDGTERLIILHDQIDQACSGLSAHHRERLSCQRGCNQCCVDDLSVYEVEAQRIIQQHQTLLAEAKPHPEGACAFLDEEGTCRVYKDRPYVCRTQGLPLRWLDDDGGDVVEYRDVCELNETDTPLEALKADECWTIGPVEERLALLQGLLDGGEYKRVSLRSLFESSAPHVGQGH